MNSIQWKKDVVDKSLEDVLPASGFIDQAWINSLVGSIDAKSMLNRYGIFNVIQLPHGADAKFIKDFHSSDGAFSPAYITPKEGMIPQRAIEGDEIFVPTFRMGNAIDWGLDYERDKRADVVMKAVEVFLRGFEQRIQDEEFKVLTYAASTNDDMDDAPMIDCDKEGGVQETICTLRRRMTKNGSKLTHLFVEPETMSDLRHEVGKDHLSANTDDEDGLVYHGIHVRVVPDISQYFWDLCHNTGKNKPVASRYQPKSYKGFTGLLSNIWRMIRLKKKPLVRVSYANRPIMLGLDLSSQDSFVMPIRGSFNVFHDPTLHRRQRNGLYGWMELGVAALNHNRAALAISEPVGEGCVAETVATTTYEERERDRNSSSKVLMLTNKGFVRKVITYPAFLLPLKSTGGWRGWWKRWW